MNPRLPPETRPGFSGDGSARGGTFEDAGALRLRLGAYLSEQVGTKVAVDRLVKFPAGFSWITYGVSVSGFEPAADLILRLGPPYGLFAPYSAMPEFLSLSALRSSPSRTPRAFYASDDISILGAPFFVCERVNGDTPLPWGGEGSALDGARRESLARDFIDALAALHSFDWRASSLARWGESVTVENAAAFQIEEWRQRFQRWALRPHPMAHRALPGWAGTCPKRPASRSCTAITGSATSWSATTASPRFSTGSSSIWAIPSRISAGLSCRNIAAARASSAVWPARLSFSRVMKRSRAHRSIAAL